MISTAFQIGENALNGAKVLLDYVQLQLHFLLAGGTGRGKSKLIELMVRYHLQHRHGLMLLDPHGFLYEDVLAYATAAGYRDRVVLIDPNDTQNSVGLNFLAPNGMDASAQAEQVMKAIAKVFGESDGDTKPRLERWMRNLLIAFIEAGLTLADMLDFLSVARPLYREAALNSVGNSYVRQEWDGFDAITKRSEKENVIEAPLNRAAKMILSEPIRRIVGQQQSSVDIGEAIEKGKIVLVNLAPTRVSRECQRVLGILLIDQVVNYAFQRSKRDARKPFFVIVDEAAELTSDDLPYSLQALRKFGIFFTLCFQTLSQIREVPGYYENVMANCDCKIAFKTSRADAEELIGELFAGHIRGDVVKDEIKRTMLIPRETVREVVSRSVSTSRNSAAVDSFGDSFTEGSASGTGTIRSLGMSDQFLPDEGLFTPSSPLSHAETSSSGSSTSSQSSISRGTSSAHASSAGQSWGESETRTIVPFYVYIREQELSSRQYYSIEEIKEKYIAWVMSQPKRHAQLKLKDNKAIPILTEFVEDVRVREVDKQRVIEKSNAKYTLPSHVVDRMIEERRQRLIEGAHNVGAAEFEEVIQNERWQ